MTRKLFYLFVLTQVLMSCSREHDKKLLCKTWVTDRFRHDSTYIPCTKRVYSFSGDNTYDWVNWEEPWIKGKGTWSVTNGFGKKLCLMSDTSSKYPFTFIGDNLLELDVPLADETLKLQLSALTQTELWSKEKFIPGNWKVVKTKTGKHSKDEYEMSVSYPDSLFYTFMENKKIRIRKENSIQEGEWSFKNDSIFITIHSNSSTTFYLEVIAVTDSLMVLDQDHTTYHYLVKTNK